MSSLEDLSYRIQYQRAKMKSFSRDNKPNKRGSGGFHDNNPRKFGKPDRFRSEDRGSSRFESRGSDRPFEKRMHSVTCAKCGDRCEVPFKPTENKPVYCYNCFKDNDNKNRRTNDNRNDSNFEQKNTGISREEFDQINEKLDKIIEALNIE